MTGDEVTTAVTLGVPPAGALRRGHVRPGIEDDTDAHG
jgi:hypothetical protein